jgi:hypothetical protein
MTDRELMQQALEALEVSTDWDMNATGKQAQSIQVINALRARLAQSAYRRGDRLLCLETDEHCVIYVSGTDRQWVKFPDSHVGMYTNEQVAEMFELIQKEAI